ncbi:MAG TPA: DUF2505 domain-containing protein [Gammaproteobacteria bacterium]|nr:DUF2505 domain-containing protein [Gammaproteobacteria bacterium]
MSVTVRARHEYRHPVKKVWAAFSDPEFYQAKFEAIGHRNVEVISTESDGEDFSIEISREVPLDVPGFLRGMLGEWNTLLQNEHWTAAARGGYENELEIEARGVPATMTGTMMLRASGKGCVNEVAITIRASVPLIGGKLEQFVSRDTEATLAAEYEFIREYLAQR